MAKGTLPPPDRASLSARARDHLHHRVTRFRWPDYLSMSVDLIVSFGATVVIGGLASLSAFKILRPGSWVPEELAGPEKYEMALWIVLTITAANGLWGLYQFWLRRIWEQTMGSKTSLWNGLLATQLLMGAVMPAACLLLLWSENSARGNLMTPWGGIFAVMALLYARHGVQVIRWSREPAVKSGSAPRRRRST